MLVSRLTAPLRASSLPSSVAPVFAVIVVSAITVPANTEFVPSVADAPICQYTLQGCAPLIRFTVVADPVVSELPT